MTPQRVVLLRHGRTAWNAEGRFQGQADPPLDDVGHRQAARAAGAIAALEPDAIVSSDLQRASATAQALGSLTGLDIGYDERLRERGLGHWEGLTRADVAELHPDELADWLAGLDVTRRGGETRAAVAVRVCAAFDDIADCGLAVVVTHSATAMALTSALLNLSTSVHVLGPLANCHWSELAIEASGWRLRAHNVSAPEWVQRRSDSELESPDAAVIDADA